MADHLLKVLGEKGSTLLPASRLDEFEVGVVHGELSTRHASILGARRIERRRKDARAEQEVFRINFLSDMERMKKTAQVVPFLPLR